jgi:hypothetical protein
MDRPDFDFIEIARRRQAMLDNGYAALAVHDPWSVAISKDGAPLAGKTPAKRLDGGSWADGHEPELLFTRPKMLNSTGMLTRGLIAFDIDVPAFDLTVKVAAIASKHGLDLSDAPLRVKTDLSWEAGKVLYLFRADAGEPVKDNIVCRDGKVEALGRGQHFVASGYHISSLDGPLVAYKWRPATGAPWTRARSDLPIASAEQMSLILNEIVDSGIIGPVKDAVPRPRGPTGIRRSGEGERLHQLREQHGGDLIKAVRALMSEAVEGTRHNSVLACVGSLMTFGEEFTRSVMEPLVREFIGEDRLNDLERSIAYSRGKREERQAKWDEVKACLRARDPEGAVSKFDEHASHDPEWRKFYGKSFIVSMILRGVDDPETLTAFAKHMLQVDDASKIVAEAFEKAEALRAEGSKAA